MLSGELFRRVVTAVLRRPRLVMAGACLLAAAGAFLALRLDVSAAIDTLLDRDSPPFKASERYKRDFGDDPIAILVQGDLRRTVLTADLGRLILLERCLAGTIPPQARTGAPRVCRELGETKPVKAVYGPGTFIDTSVTKLRDQLRQRGEETQAAAEQAARQSAVAARRRGESTAAQLRAAEAARQSVLSEFDRQVVGIGLRYGLTSLPAIDDPDFVSRLVFDARGRQLVPKARFAGLFPSPNAAVIQIRLRPGLSRAERSRATAAVKRAVADPQFRLEGGARYVVTGAPVLIEALGQAVKRSALGLLAAALLVMAGTLAVVFRTRLRLLPLAVAIGAAALTFGAVSLAGGSLTVASLAALPVLIGLAVDYAIQLQARFDEARGGEDRGNPSARRPPAAAAEVAAVVGAPTIASAGVATIAGFLVLLLSPTPMLRGFGLIVVVGIVLAFVSAVTAGFAALSRWSDPPQRPADLPPSVPRLRAAWGRATHRLLATTPARRAARTLAVGVAGARGTAALAGSAIDHAVQRPRRVLGVGVVLAVVGWAVSARQEVVSDVRRLVPQDLPALQDSAAFERETGVAGEVDVAVHSSRLTDPAIIGWMSRLRGEVLADNAYRGDRRCADEPSARLCPGFSLPDLLRDAGPLDRTYVNQLLDAIPPYFSQAAISSDRQTASLSFGIPLLPLAEQKRVIDGIERRLARPPPGVRAEVVGLPVLAADASDALSSPARRLGMLAVGIAAVFLVLLALGRRPAGAAVPLIPIALATGWSGLVLFALRIPLNPLSASLGTLVLAVSTEFAVLLSARYAQEREQGASPARAVELTYRSTGAAVFASGVTATAGFAALMASDLRVLRDFGAVTVVDLAVSLAGVMLLLPAALVWAEARGRISWRVLRPGRIASAIGGREGHAGGPKPR